MKKHKGSQFFFLALLLPQLAQGQTTPVHFQVNMQHARLERGDKVIVRGSGATLGSWLGADVVLEHSGEHYEAIVHFPQSEAGHSIHFKYVILRANGQEQWENRLPRVLIPSTGETNIPVVFFGDMARPFIARPSALQIEIDLTEASFSGAPPNGVGISGGPLGKKAPALELGDDNKDGVWTGLIEFDPLMQADCLFYFFFLVDGKWIQEPGGLKHGLLIEGDSNKMVMRYDAKKNRLVPQTDALLLDQFEAIANELDEVSSKSIYWLYAALNQLHGNDALNAQGLFRKFEMNYENDRLLDIYPRRYGNYLFKIGLTTAAKRHLRHYQQKAQDGRRKHMFAYDEGAGWLSLGKIQESISVFDEILEVDPGQFEALLGKGLSLIQVDSLRSAGRALLETIAGNTEASHLKQASLQALAHASFSDGQFRQAAVLFEQLTDFGTSEFQIKARIRALESLFQANETVLVLNKIGELLVFEDKDNLKEESLRIAANNRFQTAHLLFLKLTVLFSLGRVEEATDTLHQLITDYSDTTHGRKAARLR